MESTHSPLLHRSQTLSGMDVFRGSGPPPLSLRIPLACGCWNFRRTSDAIAKVSAPRPQTRKVCSLDHALSLSVPASLPQLCDNGGPSSPDASGSSTQRERMARRAPTGICGTVQPVTGERQPCTSDMNNVAWTPLLEEACQRTSITAPDK